MYFEIILDIFTSLIEKAIERRKKKGKSNKFVQKVFSQEAQEKVMKAFHAYVTMADELEDELDNETD